MNYVHKRDGATRPSVFDIGLYLFTFLCPIFFIKNWNSSMMQNIFFAFGTFTLLGLSFLSPKQRDYRNKYLGIIILWSLVNVFIHTFKYSLTNSVAANWINYCLMSEGFLYVLCGCLLFYLIVSYKKNFNIAYPILAISLLNLIFVLFQKAGVYPIWKGNGTIYGMMDVRSQLALFSAFAIPILYVWKKWLIIIPLISLILSNSYTGLFALFIAVALYLFIRKSQFALIWLLLAVPLYLYTDWQRLFFRLEFWPVALKQILEHPFIGSGFDNSLRGNMIPTRIGWGYIHNDYLNIARDLGIPFMCLIIVSLKNIIKKIDYLWVAITVILIACFFQTNFYFVKIASIGIVLLALKERKHGIYV